MRREGLVHRDAISGAQPPDNEWRALDLDCSQIINISDTIVGVPCRLESWVTLSGFRRALEEGAV